LALGKILPPKQSHITDLSKIKKMERFSHKWKASKVENSKNYGKKSQMKNREEKGAIF
jgi:hypothetical protein